MLPRKNVSCGYLDLLNLFWPRVIKLYTLVFPKINSKLQTLKSERIILPNLSIDTENDDWINWSEHYGSTLLTEFL